MTNELRISKLRTTKLYLLRVPRPRFFACRKDAEPALTAGRRKHPDLQLETLLIPTTKHGLCNLLNHLEALWKSTTPGSAASADASTPSTATAGTGKASDPGA
jgi:hypothetical protein